MPASSNTKTLFSSLIKAYEKMDESQFDTIREQLAATGNPITLNVQTDLQWDECDAEGYSEAPVVTQRFTIVIGDENVYDGERQFGSEKEDRTHTGLGGEWVAIRIDEGGDKVAEEVLGELGIEIAWPDVPPWR